MHPTCYSSIQKTVSLIFCSIPNIYLPYTKLNFTIHLIYDSKKLLPVPTDKNLDQQQGQRT